MYAGVKGALRAAHGAEVADGVSDYHLALEVSGACPGSVDRSRGRNVVGDRGWSVGRHGQVAVGFGPRCKPEAVSKGHPWTEEAEAAPHPVPRRQAHRHLTTAQ